MALVIGLATGCDETADKPALACGPFTAEGTWVRDARSGLLWESYVTPQQLTQPEAALRCGRLGGRLPSRKEIEALRFAADGDPCLLPACAFRGARCGTIQCGTGIGPTELHWGVTMGSGALVGIAQTQARGSLCVRDSKTP